MLEALRSRLLRALRVPPTPEPPAGAPGSVRVFRSGKNFYRIRVLRWSVAQASTLAGLLLSVWFFNAAHRLAENRQASVKAAPSVVAPPAPPSEDTHGPRKKTPPKARLNPSGSLTAAIAEVARRTPLWAFTLITVLEIGAFGFYLAQLIVTFVAVRLDYEQRWYIVTDRSLRIRRGLWQVQELTMSFANLQQVSVSQGPLQRLLGLSDVRVRTAGGGSGETHGPKHADSLHAAEFHCVEHATEIRDLILERLRRFRAAGLGDPDDHRDHAARSPLPLPPHASAQAALAAARELLAEAHALRQTVASIAR